MAQWNSYTPASAAVRSQKFVGITAASPAESGSQPAYNAARQGERCPPGARQFETAVSYLADGAWRVFQTVNRRVPAVSFSHRGRGAAAKSLNARHRSSAGPHDVRCAPPASATP